MSVSVKENPYIKKKKEKKKKTAEGKIQWVKGIFPANIKEKLVSKEHDDQEVWINVILEKFYSAVLYFLKIYPKVDHVVNIKLAFMDWQFCDLIIQLSNAKSN